MSETTGQHDVPPRDESLMESMRKELWKTAWGIILAGLVGFGGGGLAFYVKVSSEAARNDEIHARFDRDLEALQDDRREDRDDFDDMQGDVRALKAAFEAGQRDTRERLIRIENALDGRRR